MNSQNIFIFKIKTGSHNLNMKDKDRCITICKITLICNVMLTTHSSLLKVLFEKDVLKICGKFTGEHPFQNVMCKATLLKLHFGMGVLM